MFSECCTAELKFQPRVEYVFKATFTSNNCSHIHTHSHIQILYLYSGSMQYYLDGIVYPLRTGDLIIISPDKEHGFHSTAEGESATCFAFGCSGFQFPCREPNTLPLPEGTPILHCQPSIRTELSDIAEKMLVENCSHYFGKETMMQAYATQYLMILNREITAASYSEEYPTEQYSKAAIVKEITHYMYSHYMDKITLESLAKTMYLSPVYISKIFKDETGDSPINYLIRIRLSRATELMAKHPTESIKSVASQVGYDDVYHFSKLFKKYYGVSPLYYKKSENAE